MPAGCFFVGHGTGGIFFDVETDFRFGLLGRRRQERTELLVDVAESGVVDEQGFSISASCGTLPQSPSESPMAASEEFCTKANEGNEAGRRSAAAIAPRGRACSLSRH